MKKIIILSLIGFALHVEPSVAIATTKASTEATVATTPEFTDKWRKRKNRNQRKGFLWGLFRKKSGCGCPNN